MVAESLIEFQPVRGDAASTLVEQVVAAVRRAIERRALPPGAMLPSIRAFASLHRVSVHTVARAYGRLALDGWLTARPRLGYRVARPRPPRAAPAVCRPAALDTQWRLCETHADSPPRLSPGCGWLPDDWLNQDGLRAALRHISRQPMRRMAHYGHPLGYAPLRAHIAATLGERGIAVNAQRVLLTQGATQGLDIVVRTLLRPGDTMAVEQPCYANLFPILRLAQVRAVPVPRGAAGLDCVALERVARLHRPRLLFINTALHNPTGTSLEAANAAEVLALAARHDFHIVEDDVSRELLDGWSPSLAGLDGARRVIYLGGYSKSIAPSLRVGYMVAEDALLRVCARSKMMSGLTGPETMERLVHHVLLEGRHAAHTARLRDRLARAHEQIEALLDAHGFEICARPRAGLFLWARPACCWAGLGADALARMAADAGIWLTPGSLFDIGGKDLPWLRFNVAYSQDPELWRFLREAGAVGGT